VLLVDIPSRGRHMPHPKEQQDQQPQAEQQHEPPRKRKPYVKPMLHQLPYMVDQHVSLAASCKTIGAVTGPTLADCQSGSGNIPCSAVGS
jgi:hypothetical protein